jgi:hypothetical protein
MPAAGVQLTQHLKAEHMLQSIHMAAVDATLQARHM